MLARVYSVDSVRLSFTLMRDADAPALAVRAVGLVISGGWWGSRLTPWSYISPPADGLLDMDFLAEAPGPGTIVTTGIVPIVAVGVFQVPAWAQGVRVHASSNTREATFNRQAAARASSVMGGDGNPWPMFQTIG